MFYASNSYIFPFLFHEAGKKKHAKTKGSATVPSSTVLPKVSKDILSTSLATHEIDGLSAFCSGIVIHAKSSANNKSKKSQEHCRQKLPPNNNVGQSKKHALVSKNSDQTLSFTNTKSVPDDQNTTFGSLLSTQVVDLNKRKSSQCQQGLSLQLKKKAVNNNASREDGAAHPRKIYLSEKQSGVITDAGTVYPCAPPATPTAGKFTKGINHRYLHSQLTLRKLAI